MDEITTLTTLDYAGIVGSVAAGIIAIKSLTATFEWAINKLGIKFKWIEDKKADHKLLKQTAEHLTKLEERLDKDEKNYSTTDKHFSDELFELKKSIEDLTVMSKDIVEKIRTIDASNEMLKQAMVEILYDVLDKQCDKYINELHGIPSSEIKWFSERFKLYDGNLNGNHGLKHKFNYCIEKLPILPD